MTELKLTGKTLDILKNFQTINPSIAFRPGQQLSTISISKKVIAFANIDNHIESEFGVYELNKLFGAISIFKDPAIKIDKHGLQISEGKRSLNYVTCDVRDIVIPGENTPKELPTVDIEFKITDKMIKDTLKAAGILGQPNVVFECDGKRITISTQNVAKPTNESYSEDVGNFVGELSPFKIILKTENLHLMPGDYEVKISFKKIVQFIGHDVTYFVAAEANSKVK